MFATSGSHVIGMMNVERPIEEQFCQPAGNALGVNISVNSDMQLIVTDRASNVTGSETMVNRMLIGESFPLSS